MPGRAQSANPESIITIRANLPGRWLWIPDSRFAVLGMTGPKWTGQLFQPKATLSSTRVPNFSELRATALPPSAR